MLSVPCPYALTLTTSTPEAPVTSACLTWPEDGVWALQPACHCVGGQKCQGIYTSWEGPPPMRMGVGV